MLEVIAAIGVWMVIVWLCPKGGDASCDDGGMCAS